MRGGRTRKATTRQRTTAGRTNRPPHATAETEPGGDEHVSPRDAERIHRSNRAGDMDDLTLPEYRSRGRKEEEGEGEGEA